MILTPYSVGYLLCNKLFVNITRPYENIKKIGLNGYYVEAIFQNKPTFEHIYIYIYITQ